MAPNRLCVLLPALAHKGPHKDAHSRQGIYSHIVEKRLMIVTPSDVKLGRTDAILRYIVLAWEIHRYKKQQQ